MLHQEPLAPVYPRWRGELLNNRRALVPFAGLPPLARGTRKWILRFVVITRFTPAGAGNSPLYYRLLRSSAVYPRWRGELGGLLRYRAERGGLPPLARGTRLDHVLNSTAPRFTPAGAGNSNLGTIHAQGHAVYPRWRGELQCQRPCGAAFFGLPPLARGTR